MELGCRNFSHMAKGTQDQTRVEGTGKSAGHSLPCWYSGVLAWCLRFRHEIRWPLGSAESWRKQAALQNRNKNGRCKWRTPHLGGSLKVSCFSFLFFIFFFFLFFFTENWGQMEPFRLIESKEGRKKRRRRKGLNGYNTLIVHRRDWMSCKTPLPDSLSTWFAWRAQCSWEQLIHVTCLRHSLLEAGLAPIPRVWSNSSFSCPLCIPFSVL